MQGHDERHSRDPLIGAVVAGRYIVERLLATGGMASVYQIRHRSLSRRFALKTLSPSLASEPEVLARFRREAEIMAGLRHPNIVAVLDWDQLPDGAPMLILELLEGEDLDRRLARCGALPFGEMARISDEVLAGLTVVHRAGIVHRDLKPSNIFLARDDAGDERAVLLDFGISKLCGSETLANVTSILGTPPYMAPEQAEMRADAIGPATDVWAVGTILYQMATGQQAFDGDSAPAIIHAVCNERPAPLSRLRPDAPPALERVVTSCLEPDTTHRPADAEVLRRELGRAMAADFSAEETITEVAVTIAAPPRAPTTLSGESCGEVTAASSRGRRFAGAAVILAAAAFGLLIAKVVPGTSDAPPDPTPVSARPGPLPVVTPGPAPDEVADAAPTVTEMPVASPQADPPARQRTRRSRRAAKRSRDVTPPPVTAPADLELDSPDGTFDPFEEE